MLAREVLWPADENDDDGSDSHNDRIAKVGAEQVVWIQEQNEPRLRRMKHKGQQQAAPCVVVQPGEQNRPGNQEENRKPKQGGHNAVSLPQFVGWRHPLQHEQWQVPQAPSDPDDDARNQRIVAGLQSRQKESAPAQFLAQPGIEKELMMNAGINMYRAGTWLRSRDEPINR